MDWNHRFARRAAQMQRTAVRELLKLTAQPGMISFAGGLPASELFPVEEVRRAADAVMMRSGRDCLQYGETEGVAELRDWLAEKWSRKRLQLTRANVAITNGGQQALDLLGRILLDDGDRVAVENPTYLALLSAWRPQGAEFQPVSSDANGMQVEVLEAFPTKPKLVYTLPNFQNPQGTTLSTERRCRLVDWCREQGVGIVEDDPYGELRFAGETLPHLFQLDARTGTSGELDANVIHVGTFSKVLAPGLRVGWVIAAEPVIEKLVRAKQAADLHTSTLAQHLVLDLLRGGLLERHLPLLRREYRQRRDAMLNALENHFPEDVTWTRPEGGMFLLVTLPAAWDVRELLKEAIERKVAFVPGEEFHLNGAGRNTFRLNFSNASPDRIEVGVKILGDILKAQKCRSA